MFCHYCMFCYSKGLITMTNKVEDAFIVNGFNNWKKARERFGRHHLGEFHKDIRGRNFCFAKAWQFVDTRKRKEI